MCAMIEKLRSRSWGIVTRRECSRPPHGRCRNGGSSMPTDELDGVTVAPDIHRVVFENDEVRVLEITIRAGTTTPLHTHLVPTVTYRLSGSDFVRRDEQGNTMFDSRSDQDAAAQRV